MGYVILQSGDDPNNYHDLTDGSMWLNTGSGPQLIPDRWNTSFYNTDHSSDINVEVLAGLSSTNLQLVASPSRLRVHLDLPAERPEPQRGRGCQFGRVGYELG